MIAVTPVQLKDAFLSIGYRLFEDEDRCWLLGTSDDDDPMLLPKSGAVISDEVLHYALDHAQTNGRREQLCAALRIPANTPVPHSVIEAKLLSEPPEGSA